MPSGGWHLAKGAIDKTNPQRRISYGVPAPGAFVGQPAGMVIVDVTTGTEYTNGGTAASPVWDVTTPGVTILQAYDGTTQGQADLLNDAGFIAAVPSPAGLVLTHTTSAAAATLASQLLLPALAGRPASGIIVLRLRLSYTLVSGTLGDYSAIVLALQLPNGYNTLGNVQFDLALGAARDPAGRTYVEVGRPDFGTIGTADPIASIAPVATATLDVAYDASGAQPVLSAYRDGVLIGQATDTSGATPDPVEDWWACTPRVFVETTSYDIGAGGGVDAVHRVTIAEITVADDDREV